MSKYLTRYENQGVLVLIYHYYFFDRLELDQVLYDNPYNLLNYQQEGGRALVQVMVYL